MYFLCSELKPSSIMQQKTVPYFLCACHRIVFIDEIDKIVGGGRQMGSSVSSEGVQRDLLPIIEGMNAFVSK